MMDLRARKVSSGPKKRRVWDGHLSTLRNKSGGLDGTGVGDGWG